VLAGLELLDVEPPPALLDVVTSVPALLDVVTSVPALLDVLTPWVPALLDAVTPPVPNPVAALLDEAPPPPVLEVGIPLWMPKMALQPEAARTATARKAKGTEGAARRKRGGVSWLLTTGHP
jgi:hypothetical protein